MMNEKTTNMTFVPRAVLTLFAMLLFVSGGVRAQQLFSGGTGTASDPYLIATVDDLEWLTEHYGSTSYNFFYGKHFLQTEDIDCNGKIFYPIGREGHPFGGIYDGGNHFIKGFVSNYASTSHSSIFGFVRGQEISAGSGVYHSAALKNIRILDITVTDYTNGHYVAGLCALAGDSVLIENCYVTGTLTTDNGGQVAGIAFIGSNNVTVRNCFADVVIEGDNASSKAQLVGNTTANTSTIENCYYHTTDNSIPATSGSNPSSQPTRLYTATGAGLLASTANSTISFGQLRYFATGSNVQLDLTNSIKVFEAHIVNGTGTGGSIEIYQYGRPNYIEVSMGTSDIVVALTEGRITDSIRYRLDDDGTLNILPEYGIGIVDLHLPLYNSTDNIAPWKGDALPVSWVLSSSIKTLPIADTNDLGCLARYVNGGGNTYNQIFVQTDDILFDRNTENNFTPIGFGNTAGSRYPFQGSYRGQGHFIRGLNIRRTGNSEDDDHVGLFGNFAVPQNGTNAIGSIDSVILDECLFRGRNHVGAIAGHRDENVASTITNCRVMNTWVETSAAAPYSAAISPTATGSAGAPRNSTATRNASIINWNWHNK